MFSNVDCNFPTVFSNLFVNAEILTYTVGIKDENRGRTVQKVKVSSVAHTIYRFFQCVVGEK